MAMNAVSNKRSTEEKLRLFRRFFTGLTNVYGTYDPMSGRVRQVKESVTDEVVMAHLKGEQPYGVYLLVGDRTRVVVVDFDEADLGPPMEFVEAAQHYGIQACIERSKSKGYHVWIFFDEPGVLARKARLVTVHILSEIGKPHTEVFPKQDSLDTRATYGNFINAPLFGALVPRGRTVFVNAANPTKTHPDQWDYLEGVRRVPETVLDEIIEINELDRQPAQPVPGASSSPDRMEYVFGLPPCAQRMLTEGVTDHQRVACFRLAVHLKRAGVPCDIAVAALRTWARKNRPQGEKRIITDVEILAQTQSAYDKNYRGCGCEDPSIARYCDPRCWLYRKTQDGQAYRSEIEITKETSIPEPTSGTAS